MRYGLLADIHEDLPFLRTALDRFRGECVDRVIVLGDIFETGRALEGTTQLLCEAGAEGVWGNHDFGLCVAPHPDVVSRFSAPCRGFMQTLRPRLEFEDCVVSHVEPWRDAEDLFELWAFESDYQAGKSFDALPHRIMLHGHHHRWKVTTPDGPLEWDCFHPLPLDVRQRYLIQVGAVCDGRCGILDTTANLLIPIDLRDGN
jgi:predicted phosphodiesterase